MTLLAEWVEKAEEDYRGLIALNRLRARPVPSLVCYPAQQCAEKYLKAYLVARGVLPPRVHELPQLLMLCCRQNPRLVALQPDAMSLNPHSVAARYPGTTTTLADAREATQAAVRIRRRIRRTLGL